ncbi:hypothetical protein Tco_1134332 [Tanacetum coccineum]
MPLRICVVVSQAEPMQLLLRRPRLQIMVISNGLKSWSLTQCGVKYQSTMTNMLFGESHIGGANVNNSLDFLLTRNPLWMSTKDVESLLSQSFRLLNGMVTNIWIGSPFLTNLNVEEHLAFSVSLRMFTRSIVIQRRVEDLQLGVKSYQKKLNITNPDTYISDLKQREAYSAYSNPRGFIYQNKDKNNKMMRIDKLHKFSDSTLNDVRTTLDDRLKRIRMEYLP